MSNTRAVTVYSDDPLFGAVLAMLGGATSEKSSPPKGKDKRDKAKPAEEDEEDDEEEEEGDSYEEMKRPALKKEVRGRGLLKQVRNSVTDDDLREMLRADDGGGEEEEDDEEEDDDEDEVEEEEETEVEVGMKVKIKVKGKTLKGEIVKIDYAAGKVTVKASDGKRYKVSPENLSM